MLKHDWFTPKGIPYRCCRNCGAVRQADGSNDDKPCPGRVKVLPR